MCGKFGWLRLIRLQEVGKHWGNVKKKLRGGLERIGEKMGELRLKAAE